MVYINTNAHAAAADQSNGGLADDRTHPPTLNAARQGHARGTDQPHGT